MLTATLTALALSTVPAVDHIAPPTPAAIVVAGNRRKRERRAARRNGFIALGGLMLFLDDELDNCVATYAVHYGPNVEALCQRDILNWQHVPLEARQEWARQQGLGN